MRYCTLLSLLFLSSFLFAQDTFSIVAVDSVTGEVGSAGASCLDASIVAGGVSIIGDLIPGQGAINTQSFYLANNQNAARNQMLNGATPTQIISFLVQNDAQGDSTQRQYGIAAFDNNTSPQAAAFTGSNCFDYKGQIVGSYYAIQGNILLGPEILDSMESRFLNTSGDLATRLMAALQGANVPGADSRCLNEGVSSQSAFIRVARPNDLYGAPYLDLVVAQTPFGVEPIDSLQALFDSWTPPNCEAMVPANVIRVQQSIDTSSNNQHFWVCAGDTLRLSGTSNTIYLESGATYLGGTGGINTVYLQGMSRYDGASQTINTIYLNQAAEIIAPGIASNVISCDSIQYDLSNVVGPLCGFNTSLEEAAKDWEVLYERGTYTLRLRRTLGTEAGELQLYDLNGNVIQQEEVASGTEKISWSLSDLSSGLYLLSWRSAKRQSTMKLLIH